MKGAFPEDETNISQGRVFVVGVGNRLLGDEGVGPRVIDKLSRIKLPPCVSVLDCGCDVLSIALYLDRPKKIVIVDAIRAGGEPGRIYKFGYGELTANDGQMCSAHQIGSVAALRLLRLMCPALTNTEIIVIGVEPKTIELDAGLSKDVKKCIPKLMRLILEEIPSLSSSSQKETWEQMQAFFNQNEN